jgi:Glycosyltransferases involved in cell wall biogenesis
MAVTIADLTNDLPAHVRLAVVVPLASEGATVTEFLTGLVERLGAADLVFCVLDSVSQDDTRAKVEAFGLRDPRVRLVWAPEDRSVVDAYFRGYREAFAAGAEWILEMDGGMSHRPEEVPRFTSLIDRGYDYVVGCRFMEGGSHTGGRLRRSVSAGGSALARVVLGTRMRDMTSGFEMFSRSAMEHVLRQGVRSRANFFQTEIKYMLRNWRWIEVPVNYRSTNNRVAPGSITEAIGNLWRLRSASKTEEGSSCPRP